MSPQLQTPTKKVSDMPQVMKLQDVASKFRDLVESFNEKKDECIIQDEQNRTVAVVLPVALYQLYQQEWDRDFAVLDDVAEDLKDYSPEELEARISKAVEEVKAIHNAKRATT